METNDFRTVIDEILNFKINTIPDDTRFWMIRTKKGYFYKEFIAKKYVALAWNTITSHSDFSQNGIEQLNDSIIIDYPEIKRPTLVTNKCKSFISEIKPGDILVIPSAGSKFITFAIAGEYYEEETKTYELERKVIGRIERHDVVFDDITCPYKKRRHIQPLRTIKGDELNYHLYKAITSYHGICNLDDYSNTIIDHLYNCYSFKNQIRLVFHVSKTDPITSKEFSGFLYSVNDILTATNIDEHDISTQASIHSVGDIVFTIKNIMAYLSDNYLWFVALVMIVGGGKALSIELPGLLGIIKQFISLKHDVQKNQAEADREKYDNYLKALELKTKMEESGVTLDELANLESSIDMLSKCRKSMDITPISHTEDFSLDDYVVTTSESDDEEEV